MIMLFFIRFFIYSDSYFIFLFYSLIYLLSSFIRMFNFMNDMHVAIEVAHKVAKLFASDHLRVYPSTDVIGVEVGGALKNIFAIAAGLRTDFYCLFFFPFCLERCKAKCGFFSFTFYVFLCTLLSSMSFFLFHASWWILLLASLLVNGDCFLVLNKVTVLSPVNWVKIISKQGIHQLFKSISSFTLRREVISACTPQHSGEIEASCPLS